MSRSKTIQYVALLRGINSGKNPSTKMDVLRKAFETMGYENVSTILATGNVIFTSPESNPIKIEKNIFETLPSFIGFESDVIVRPVDDILALVRSEPFSPFNTFKKPRLYATFIHTEQKIESKYPIQTEEYVIIDNFDGVVCSMVFDESYKTPDLMKTL
ncbi:MAG: DUF1697 domain-containing protein, partial [Saprospiraceae bacterium]|nr:DUF1697 domain-containing protein [Saprospiraceae bacterium]